MHDPSCSPMRPACLSEGMRGLSAWARECLRQPQALAFPVAESPWSMVVRLECLDGSHWFAKQPAAGLACEPGIADALALLAGEASVATAFAREARTGRFLARSRGHSLRSIFDGALDAGLLAQGIQAHRSLQRASMPGRDRLLAAGAQDWSPGLWLGMLASILDDHAWLRAHGVEAGLASAARSKADSFAERVERLLGFAVPMALDHGDLHDGNLVLDPESGSIATIDVGEAAWGHPLMSLAWCFERSMRRYGIAERSEAGALLAKACFGGWLGGAAEDAELARAARDLVALWRVLGEERLLRAADPAGSGSVERLRGRLSDSLRWLAA